MVCLGNICRSPLAQGILEHKIQQAIKDGFTQFQDWEVDSAGTSSYHAGEAPSEGSCIQAEKHGFNIRQQKSRPFRAWDFEHFDLIYTMDTSNYNDVLKLAENDQERAKVSMILNEAYPGKNQAVPDPYFGTFGYDKVYDLLDEACEKIIIKYK